MRTDARVFQAIDRELAYVRPRETKVCAKSTCGTAERRGGQFGDGDGNVDRLRVRRLCFDEQRHIPATAASFNHGHVRSEEARSVSSAPRGQLGDDAFLAR